MASKSQAALSANLQQLSYAMSLTQPLEVSVTSGVRPGPLERRRQDPTRVSPGEIDLEFESGKPFKNFGRLLAREIGVPLPYQFRQARESAEQARIDYENQSALFGDAADTFLAQMGENATTATTESMKRQYLHYAAQGKDAIDAFFAEDASPAQRAEAEKRFAALNQAALQLSSAESQDDAQQKRKVQLEQYVKSSNELLDVRSAVAQTGRSVENYNRGRAVLKGLNYDAPELQQFMRNAAADVLGASGQAAKLGLGAVNPALAVLDSFLASEGRLLDPEVMDELINTIGKSNIEHGQDLLKGLAESNQKIIGESPALRDMPSFGTIPFQFDTPATDAYWQQRSGGAVQRDIIDTSTAKNTALGGLGAAGEAAGSVVGKLLELINPGVELTEDAQRRAQEAGLLPPDPDAPRPGRGLPASGIIQRPTR